MQVAQEDQWWLTVDGKLEVWQHTAQTFESAIRMMANGLVDGAVAINTMVAEGADFEDCIDLGNQWREDLNKLPAVARRQVLTRMVVAGIPEPKWLREEEV